MDRLLFRHSDNNIVKVPMPVITPKMRVRIAELYRQHEEKIMRCFEKNEEGKVIFDADILPFVSDEDQRLLTELATSLDADNAKAFLGRATIIAREYYACDLGEQLTREFVTLPENVELENQPIDVLVEVEREFRWICGGAGLRR